MIVPSTVLLLALVVACRAADQAGPTVEIPAANPTARITSPAQQIEAPATPTLVHTSSPTASKTSLPSPTASRTPTQTATISPTPSQTETPGPSPTNVVLRGTVLEQANCRYGPGAAYLYKYGLYPDFRLEITGRNEAGTWIVIQAIGGTNPCWVKASLLEINGDVMSLPLASLPLPQSPYYGPLSGVSAQRSGNSVVISWNPLYLRAGDDSLQYPYLVEAWLCQAGNLVFTPTGSWETSLTVQDEPGCAQPSHARVYGVEKHGYTAWVAVPWPAP